MSTNTEFTKTSEYREAVARGLLTVWRAKGRKILSPAERALVVAREHLYAVEDFFDWGQATDAELTAAQQAVREAINAAAAFRGVEPWTEGGFLDS